MPPPTKSEESELDVAIEELKRPTLKNLCLAEIAVAWLWIAVFGLPNGGFPLPYLIPAAIMFLFASCLLAIDVPLPWQSALFPLNLACVFLVGALAAPSVAWIYAQALVVSVTGLLLGPLPLFGAAAALTVVFLFAIPGLSDLYTQVEMLTPLGFLWATTLTAYLSTHNLHLALDWALNSERRAWRIAKEARQRRGELGEALHSLTTTAATLERTKRELEMARREAEEAREIKSRFVANVSHELRTPLNIIVGFAEMLCTSPEMYDDASWTPALREDLLTIWRNGEHLLKMVDDVLDLAQIEAAHLPLRPRPTEVVSLLRDVLDNAQALFRDADCELRRALPSEEYVLNIDDTRIRQILLNLINNALRFTAEGYVEVGAHRDGEEIIIYVRDTGAGIPEDKLEVIFEEFEQADTSIRRSHQGAGLGLAISKQLVELHGGRIWGESELGQGSTFYLSLPLLTDHSMQLSPRLLRTRPTARREEKERTMVVVCSDPLVVRLLERHVEGTVVLATPSCAEAVPLIREHHPQTALVVADTPEQLATATKEAQHLLEEIAPFDLPVVVGTFPTERSAGAALGESNFLIKPITEEEMASAVQCACEDPRRVLIVEDELDMLRLLARMVRHRWPEAEVLTTTSGREAIALAQEAPDVLLLDLLLPDINGPQVLQAIRSDGEAADIPVVVITARGPAEDLAPIQRGELHVLKNSSFSANELMECLGLLNMSLPAHYQPSSTSEMALKSAGGRTGLRR
ncbi:MAG: hybrid sensor histidine kinase/response regulator [Chloroflexota bacterium]|nr:hybrid sensor histidine kinase/response regulator [Chloroflexota bacterium]